MTTFFLVRHGNIDMPDRIPGRLPGIHLSDAGRQQANDMARSLSTVRIDALACSPLERAIETAEPIVRMQNVPLHIDEKFVEIDFGSWTGQSFAELEYDERWKQFHSFRNGCRVPGGELMVEVQARFVSGLEKLRAQLPDGNVVVVSHNDPIKAAVAFYLGVPLELFLRLEIGTGSLSMITRGDSNTASVACVNASGPAMQRYL